MLVICDTHVVFYDHYSSDEILLLSDFNKLHYIFSSFSLYTRWLIFTAFVHFSALESKHGNKYNYKLT